MTQLLFILYSILPFNNILIFKSKRLIVLFSQFNKFVFVNINENKP